MVFPLSLQTNFVNGMLISRDVYNNYISDIKQCSTGRTSTVNAQNI